MRYKLLITSTDLMMIQFLVPHVRYLLSREFDVEVACSEVGNRFNEVSDTLKNVPIHKVRSSRSPARISSIKGYIDIRKLLRVKKYDLIWTNEPVMGIITRLAARQARKKGTKVLYMTHGYHFYRGGLVKYKLFYPIEKFASRFCDGIATINYEDYELTKRKFYVEDVFHLNGIGLERKKFDVSFDTSAKRRELNLSDDDFIILSVGELKPHKNHQVIINALSRIDRQGIVYLICGKGELLESLTEQAKRLGVSEKVRFLGYRRDINEILHCADAFVFPSIREGLGLASLEAMSVGVPVIGADTRGVVDYVKNGETGFLCQMNNPQAYADAITNLYDHPMLRVELSKNCKDASQKYDISIIQIEIEQIICRLIGREK
ncbi:MAG: glycosyltransferase [Petrimonas sp.]|nr:glycosyltransferase [Petrimonas sp.]